VPQGTKLPTPNRQVNEFYFLLTWWNSTYFQIPVGFYFFLQLNFLCRRL
jgi:hypothetical protein